MLPNTAILVFWLGICARASSGHMHPRRVHRLFGRASDASTYPTMDAIGPAPLQAWIDTYNQVKAQGLIPSFSNATNQDGWPVYPSGVNTASADVCSFTLNQCTDSDDIVNAPDGYLGVSFDDGPQLPTPAMLDFLSSNAIPSTHFMIGSRILENPTIFQQTYAQGGHLAVHTWSHPLMTTLTDLQVLGELGWTMQIIYDQTNGTVPKFWRPPYGDVDMRVRAIAKQVFGLTTTLWNQDSKDWCLADDGTEASGCSAAPKTDAQLARLLKKWFTGSQTPGLIVLEHEHHNRSITAFVNAYPLIKSSKWTVANIPDLFGEAWYANAKDNTSTILPLSVGSGLSSAQAVLGSQTGSAESAAATETAAGADGSSGLDDRASTGSKAAATGWQSLAKGAQYGIIAGSAVAGVLILSLIALCCWRRRKSKNSTNLSPSVKQRFSRQITHPYNRFDSSAADSFEKSREKLDFADPVPIVAFPSSRSPSPRDQKDADGTQLLSNQNGSGFLGVPAPYRSNARLSEASVYSQGGEDPFAAPSPGRQTAFHLPSRAANSPYADAAERARGKDWI